MNRSLVLKVVKIQKSSRGKGGGGEQTSYIKPPIPQPPFWRMSGRQVPKPPFDAARKYDEVGNPVEKLASRRASLSAPILAIFPARSGRQASKPPFEAARKYDEVGIPVEKNRKPPSLPVPILANFPARSGRRASQPLFQQ